MYNGLSQVYLYQTRRYNPLVYNGLLLRTACLKIAYFLTTSVELPAILGKSPWPKLGKMIDLTSKVGEINDIEHNKDSKIYP